MKMGDRVHVFPHGDRKRAVLGKVASITRKGRAIAVIFTDRPAFLAVDDPGIQVHPVYGVVMLAARERRPGKVFGPWIEEIGGQRYEIEVTP